MGKNEKIIVSMTSWVKRINNVVNVLKLMECQTLTPYKIILNLSTEEFSNKEKDLPGSLLKYINDHNNIELYWVNENTKPYKKLIPTLKRFPNDIIITIDDDIVYPRNFIEMMYNKFLFYGRKYPITACHFKWGNDISVPNGGYTLYKKDFFGKYLDDLYNNLYLKSPEDFPFSDLIFAYAILLNGGRFKTIDLDMQKIRMKTHDKKTAISNMTFQTKKKSDIEHKLIRNYILKTYNKTYNDITCNIKKQSMIIVNFTTWKKRHDCVPEMMKYFNKQVLKPNKIFCWLSREEYDENNLPKSLKECVDKKYFEIKWVDKNTFCHKRHEVFKEYNDCYNIFIDDDNIYPETLVKELYEASIKNTNTIISYIGYTQDYIDTNRIMNTYNPKLGNSFKHTFLGNGVIFPPYTFPIESFKYADIRDKIVPICDESWLVPWFIKNNIKLNVLHDRSKYKDFKHINGTQKQGEAVFTNMNKREKNGVREKEKNFTNVIKFLGIEDEINRIWPKFNIDKCYDKELFKKLSIKPLNTSKKNKSLFKQSDVIEKPVSKTKTRIIKSINRPRVNKKIQKPSGLAQRLMGY